jgi:hypothetical protein
MLQAAHQIEAPRPVSTFIHKTLRAIGASDQYLPARARAIRGDRANGLTQVIPCAPRPSSHRRSSRPAINSLNAAATWRGFSRERKNEKAPMHLCNSCNSCKSPPSRIVLHVLHVLHGPYSAKWNGETLVVRAFLINDSDEPESGSRKTEVDCYANMVWCRLMQPFTRPLSRDLCRAAVLLRFGY